MHKEDMANVLLFILTTVEHRLVVEIAFDSIHLSPRHKSGVSMRFPRVNLIRWDKPVEEADQLSDIKNLI